MDSIMRFFIRSFTVWAFAVVTGPAFGAETLLSGTCSNSAWRVRVTGVVVGNNVPDGTYGFSRTSKRDDNGSSAAFGSGTVVVVNGGGTITNDGNSVGEDALSFFSNGTRRHLEVGQSSGPPGVAIVVQGGNAAVGATRQDCNAAQCGACDHGGGLDYFDNTATIVMGNGIQNTGSSHFQGALHVGAHGAAHTFTLKINGAVASTQTITANHATAFTSQIILSKTPSTNNDTYEWLVDGVSQGGVKQVALANIGTVEAPIWDFTAVFDATIAGGDAPTPTPAATPTPTAFPTATPYATPTPTPGGTPPPSIIKGTVGGQNVFSTAVTVVNPADIYNPILAELKKTNTLLSQQSSNDGNVTVTNPLDIANPITDKLNYDSGLGNGGDGLSGDHEEGDYDERGHLDELQGEADNLKGARDNVVSSLTSVMNGFMADLTSLQGMTFGSVTAVAMPFSSLGNAPAVGKVDLPASIDLTDFLPAINVLREVLLWLLRLGFFIMTYRLVMSRGVQSTV